jgi:hypothetical protein
VAQGAGGAQKAGHVRAFHTNTSRLNFGEFRHYEVRRI